MGRAVCSPCFVLGIVSIVSMVVIGGIVVL